MSANLNGSKVQSPQQQQVVSKKQSLPKSITVSSISTPQFDAGSVSPKHRNQLVASPPKNDDDQHKQQHLQQTAAKVYEANTYVQLEIDNNNALCVPRTCKFTIKKLVLKRELIQQMLQTTSTSAALNNQDQEQNHLQDSSLNNSQQHLQQANSLIIAIKLNVSKRILRAVELPLSKLVKTQEQLNNDHLAINLNLFYSITYSHYLKKPTNFLYIYIQRRKKYKNRTILGYKTLAFAKIDLQSVLQRTYNCDLLLETMPSQGLLTTQTPLATTPMIPVSSSVNNSNSASVNNKYVSSIMLQNPSDSSEHVVDVNQLQQQHGHQICGFLAISSLYSQAYEYQLSEIEQHDVNSSSNKKSSMFHHVDVVDLDAADEDEVMPPSSSGGGGNPLTSVLATLTSKNKALNTALNNLVTNRSANSDSDVDNIENSNSNAIKMKRGSNKRSTISSTATNKKFTGKLIQFIRKLRINDDITSPVNAATTSAVGATASNNTTINENDEQISDFSDNVSDIGSASDIEADLYSIISTPKPCLQPFFKAISTSDTTIATRIIQDDEDNAPPSHTLHQQNYTNALASDEEDYMIDSTSDSEQPPTTQLMESPGRQQQKVSMINVEHIVKNLDALLQSSTVEVTYNLLCDASFYAKLKDTALNAYLFNLAELQSTQQRDLRTLIDTLVNWFNANKQQLLMLFNKKYQQMYYYSQQQQQQQQVHQLFQIRFVIFGNDQFLNHFLQTYVELFKTQDMLNLFKFYFVPYYTNASSSSTTQTLAKYLYQVDPFYQSLFSDDYWLQLDSNLQKHDTKDIMQRVQCYLKYSAQSYVQLPICEVMINIDQNKAATNSPPHHQQVESHQGVDSEQPVDVANTAVGVSSRFIPFICDVKIGGNITTASLSTSCTTEQLYYDEQSSSPSHNNTREDNISPPNSPNPTTKDFAPFDEFSGLGTIQNDYDLQVDYWTQNASLPSSSQNSSSLTSSSHLQSIVPSVNSASATESPSAAKVTKSTTKGLFKFLHVSRIPSMSLNSSTTHSNLNSFVSTPSPQYQLNVYQYGLEQPASTASHNLSMTFTIKEKKQKIMRLGKKSKDSDQKKESIDGLTRLVCTSRTQDVPLKLYIDGLEWRNIKFFQISSQWQGHIKYLNIMFGGSANKLQTQSNSID